MTPYIFAAIGGVFLLAGLVKGVVGLGLPTISMALLALMMRPAEAMAWLIVPSLVTNLWQVRPWRTLGPMLRRLGGMQAGVCLGTWFGAWLIGAPAGAWATVTQGVALLAYALWGLFGSPPTLGPRTERWLGPLAGATTGVITAATGVFVIPALPYLQSLKLERDELIQAMGMSFTISTLSLAVGLAFNHSYSVGAAGVSVFMLVPALLGMYAGQRLRGILSPHAFKRCFLGSLALLGLYLAASGLRVA